MSDKNTKKCVACGEIKDEENFYFWDKIIKKRCNTCKECVSIKNKIRKNNKNSKFLPEVEKKYLKFFSKYEREPSKKDSNLVLKYLKKLLEGKINCNHCGKNLSKSEDIFILQHTPKGSSEVVVECCCEFCCRSFQKSLSASYKYFEKKLDLKNAE